MVEGRLDDAAARMEGRLIAGEPSARWRGAALDSRRVTPGELFFALTGERTDGHRFVGDALGRGAAAAVVHESMTAAAGAALIEVDDTYRALHRLTRAVRATTPHRLVAITGSVGKTTTKELLAAMLGRRFRVAANPGNLNSLFGFPLALLGIPEDTEWMVAEMAMSTPLELAELSRLGRPDVAVFTNVRAVHLESFASVDAIAEAKAELLQGLAPDGLVVANRDDPRVVGIARRHGGRVVWFGRHAEADYRATEIAADPAGGSRFVLTTDERRQPIRLAVHGLYNVDNCLAAAACAAELGVPLEQIATAAAAARPAAMRGVVLRLRGERTLVDDSYNSNPWALECALESAAALPARRRWAVLGEMLELGETSPELHRAAGRAAAEKGFSPLLGVGELARHLLAGAAEAGAETLWLADAAAAAAAATERFAEGDLVLVKGSRGVGLERVVAALEAEGGVG